MANSTKTLIDKIETLDIAIGDIAILTGQYGNIAGYVVSYDNKNIKMSHESPFQEDINKNMYNPNTAENPLWKYIREGSKADKTYSLNTFSYYQVLFKNPLHKTCPEDKKPNDIKIQKTLEKIPYGVGPGKILWLANDDIQIAGFVLECNYEKVRLSHEDPLNRPLGPTDRLNSTVGNGRKEFGRGDRNYELFGFTKYAILYERKKENGTEDPESDVVQVISIKPR